ncbi:hypothetical protein [Candidatus Leptofilum sp.]|uniref:hypothetical protein n=1 Tax=Candidatus Leptofilum sp. TaxID=3241576 RepID=UPI003B5B4897
MNQIREQFEEINGRLLEAKKAVRERDRILSLMASLDESLEVEKSNITNLTVELDEAKERVEELEGLTWTAVWQKLIGNHEEELSEEAAKLAALKMAHEASEIKIQSIQNSLQEFEAVLVDLATCDEELTAVLAEQQAFLVANGRLPAEKITQLNQQISEGQSFLREATEALSVGKKAGKAVAALFQRIATAKTPIMRNPRGLQMLPVRDEIHHTYTGMGAIVLSANEVQPMLNLFQLELEDIGVQMMPPPNLAVPELAEVMPHFKSSFENNEPQRVQRIRSWKKHLESLYDYLRKKMDSVEQQCRVMETAVTDAQIELQTLIEEHWQEVKNE